MTYRELITRLTLIRQGFSVAGEPKEPIYTRKGVGAGAMLAIRRFVREGDKAMEKYQADFNDIMASAREQLEAEGHIVDEKTLLPDEHQQLLDQLLDSEAEIHISPIPLEVLVEGDKFTLLDLELLAPIIADE